ncbi:MAG: hypothetical protein JST50_17080 [Bacteroidetes bacterium]|jgi:hypothetical protein|nr:hypothetical protein [Bacteroidota bacterium]
MKILLLLFFVALGFQTASAQNNDIKGTVQGENGKLLHYAMIADSKYNNIAFTDSVGDFTIATHPDSKLMVQFDGYRDTLIDANMISQNPQIDLKPVVSLPVETIGLGVRTAMTADGRVAVVRRNAYLVGSRYLLDAFVPGYFTYADGKKFYNKNCLFNYEKVSGFVLLTVDKQTVREVNREQIKSFTLYDKTDRRYDFEQVPEIDKIHYVQVLASGPKYKIVKLIRTNFSSSGVAHTAAGDIGQDYDEYSDEAEYYVFNVQTKQLQKITLKKRALKEAFQKETDKVNKFMSENDGSVDDDFLGKLGVVVNS